MPRTFKDSLAADAAAMLSADEFGIEIVHTSPDGTTETIIGVLDSDALDSGQPPPLNDNGAAIHERAILELLPTVQVVEERSAGAYPSRFLIDGQVWIAKRIVGRDDATQSVEIHRVTQKATRKR